MMEEYKGMNILQKIYFPQDEVCNIETMFFRTTKDNTVYINKNDKKYYFCNKESKISTNTYFNSFSSTKWKKYTCIDEFILNIETQGKFKFKLIYSYLIDGVVQHDVVKEEMIESVDKKEFNIRYNFGLDAFEGIYFFEIECLSEEGIFYGGTYYTEKIADNQIFLGIIMCTFKREEFIKRNISILKNCHIDNIELFIVDNAGTLSSEFIQDNNIHLIYNKNAGGAGGFTRGIIEVKQSYNYCTHIILMDDDILLNCIAIEKTISYLQYTKQEHSDLFVGGATLRLDQKNLQLESGAIWNNNILFNLKAGLDLNKEKDLLYNNLEESYSYNSWVFLCIPLQVVTMDNLPLPVFVRGDDMEYGKRLIGKLLTMNGIGVWHVPVHNKYSAFMTYYVLRNVLILNALYDKNFKAFSAIKLLVHRLARELIYYRYDNVNLIFRAYEDFLCGIKFLKCSDGENLHKEISKNVDKLHSYKELEQQGYPFSYCKYHYGLKVKSEKKYMRFFRLATLNGYLLPNFIFKKGVMNIYNIVEFTNTKPMDFFRYKTVLQVDLTTQKGTITKINRMKLVKSLVKLLKMSIKILFSYNCVVREYKNNINEITNIKFWEKYLDIRRSK